MQLIGVDTGGTFTDAVLITESGQVFADKALSTPGRVEDGVFDALTKLAGQCGQPLAVLLADTDVLAHGTTVGLNAVLTATGATVGVLTTRGFESTLAIAKANKVHGLDDIDLRQPTRWDKPRQLVPRRRVLGVPERIDRTGAVLDPLDEVATRAAVRALAGHGVNAVAVCLLWSPVNPAHEQRVAQIVRAELPQCHVSLSSELAPRIGEYERTSSVVLDAYVAPLVSAYLDRLQHGMVERGFDGLLLLTRMGGGVQPLAAARRAPIHTLRSGPAGGIAATARIGETLGHRNVIATDVGGTSFDVGLVLDGAPVYAQRPMIDRHALALPVIDIPSIGTGGGSVAWVDSALGTLRVGPHSAGAAPGPACYGRGGTRPTLTDAAAVLGYVERLGTTLDLDVVAATEAIRREIAEPLGLSVDAAAEGIVRVACEQMKDLVRRTTVERGHDPADFALYAYGGAGPQWAGRYAAGLGVGAVVVPAFAAQLSAFGAIVSDLRATAERDLAPAALAQSLDRINVLSEELAAAARDQLQLGRIGRYDAHPPGLLVRRSVGLRFYRQVHRVDIPLPDGPVGRDDVSALEGQFRQAYEKVVGPGSANAATAIEVVAVAAEATLPRQLPPAAASAGPGGAERGATRHREACFDGERRPCPVHRWEELPAGREVAGPAFIESSDTTVVVYPGQRARLDAGGHVLLSTGGPDA